MQPAVQLQAAEWVVLATLARWWLFLAISATLTEDLQVLHHVGGPQALAWTTSLPLSSVSFICKGGLTQDHPGKRVLGREPSSF